MSNVRLVSYTNPVLDELKDASPEEILVYIARVSSNRDDKREDYDKLIKYLIDNSHWSPFEHLFFTFEITTSRAIGRQLLRHRSATFQEFSQRYSKATSFEPIELRKQGQTNRQSSEEAFVNSIAIGGEDVDPNSLIETHLKEAETIYNLLVNNGVAKETARMILPEATTTVLYMTAPLRTWIHFIDERLKPGAQKEIRIIAEEIKSLLKPLLPITSKTLNW